MTTPTLPDLTILPEDQDSPEVQSLIAAMYAELTTYYGEAQKGRFTPLNVNQPGAWFLVARVGGNAIACGAVLPLEAGVGEVKRMYVVPAWRSNGVAEAVLADLEGRALDYGYDAPAAGDRFSPDCSHPALRTHGIPPQ